MVVNERAAQLYSFGDDKMTKKKNIVRTTPSATCEINNNVAVNNLRTGDKIEKPRGI